MPDKDREALISEAADIYVRLREDIENSALLSERDAFLSRGDTEREVYAQVQRAWEGVGRKPGPNKPVIVSCLFGLLAAGYFGFEPIRNAILADFTTGTSVQQVALASGDSATLDADTAIADDTDGPVRRISLYAGAALFTVEKDARAFVVSAGDVTIQVLGTTFEASQIGETTVVSVSEGVVQVTIEDRAWELTAGDQLQWSPSTGAAMKEVDAASVALWRADRFVADGLTFAQVAEVIDRRLRGSVYIRNDALANSRISGTINLQNPELALEALAASRNARVVSLGPVGWLLLP